MGKLYNRVKMTVSGTPGTGTITLGTAIAGFQSFATAGTANGDVVSYVIEDGTNWEIGQGTYTSAGTTLARTTITASSSAGSAITATSNAIVMNAPLAADFISPVGPTLTGLKEIKTAPTISTNTLTLDCSAGNVFAVSLNANITTLTFTNIPASGTAYGMTLSFTADGTARTITWPAAVKWPGGTAPTLTATLNKADTFVLTTWDAGTTWYAFTAGQNA